MGPEVTCWLILVMRNLECGLEGRPCYGGRIHNNMVCVIDVGKGVLFE
jgi:hypothetical protein